MTPVAKHLTRGLGILATVAVLRGPVAASDVTSCGQVLATSEPAVLQADLDCSAEPRVCLPPGPPTVCTTHDDCPGSVGCGAPLAVALAPGGKLDLNGHTITGAQVICQSGLCTIRRGALQDSRVFGAKNVRVSHVDFAGPGLDGFATVLAQRNLTLTNVTMDGAAHVAANGRLKAVDVSVTNSPRPYDAVSSNLSVSGKRLVVSHNAGNGICSPKVQLRDSTVTGNSIGVIGSGPTGSVRLFATDVSGNLLDLMSATAPRLSSSPCEHSTRLSPDGLLIGTWGICTLDGPPAP